jgi:hypothetical protein
VINRMRLAADAKNYRPYPYVPNNQLWVEDNEAPAKVAERNLSELAKQYSPKEVNGRDSETERLMKDAMHFEYADDLTKGSVAVEGEAVVIGAEKWDRIYRVVLDRN